MWSSGRELVSLGNATIEPLSGFSCIPVVTKGVAFEQKEPSLKIYLGNNRLQRLPSAIFTIEHITLLSLRGNRLTEIPPAIGKMKNLEVLNISQNALTSLPYELMELFLTSLCLTDVLLHPNPFFKPKRDSLPVRPDLASDDDTPPEPAVPLMAGKPFARFQGEFAVR